MEQLFHNIVIINMRYWATFKYKTIHRRKYFPPCHPNWPGTFHPPVLGSHETQYLLYTSGFFNMSRGGL